MSDEEKRRWRGKPHTGDSRQLTERVKKKKLKESSRQWVERQLNDPYVARARAEGYRARAAYKLIELDDKFHFLKKGARVVVIGAFPEISHPHISYPMAAVRGGRGNEGRAFAAFLQTSAARAVFQRQGFVVQH